MARAQRSAEQASLAADDLDDLAAQLRAIFDIRDRRYGLPPKRYPKCFVGSEAVRQMIERGFAVDEHDAVRIGNLLVEAGAFAHVLNEHAFKNEYLFYRFRADADHGQSARKTDGTKVSWADFLAPFTDDKAADNLQPRIPARDPNLAEFDQDELDAIGVSPLDAHNVRLLDNVHPPAWRDPLPKPRYNVVVIGAGAGGLVSSAAAAGLGAHVALIESHLLGGDCLNVGCVPSKALLRCAHVAHSARQAHEYGVRVESVAVDFPAVMERMRRLRAQIAPNDSAQRYAGLGVDVFIGRARFSGRNSVEVNGKTLTFAKAIVATGGTAAIPAIPGLSQVPYLTNATIFNLTELPRHLAVIGAGPIGMELAQAFRRFGAAVTVFCRGQALPKEDPEAARLVIASMERDGVVFQGCTEYSRIERGRGKTPIHIVVQTAAGERTVKCDALLVATGRKPSVLDLGLGLAGVDYDARAGISVNDRLQTSNPNIYAVGDVASRYQFTHMADFMARMVIRNALFLGRDQYSRLLVPWATFTDPEVAHVGLYEHDLKERGIEYTTYARHLHDVDRAILEGQTEGFVKIHVKKGSDKILGATIVGPHAGDMISELTVAMQADVGLGRLASMIHPYPTTAEAIRQCGDAYNRTRVTPTIRKVFNRLMALQRGAGSA